MRKFTFWVFLFIYTILALKIILNQEITNSFLFVALISYLEYKSEKED